MKPSDITAFMNSIDDFLALAIKEPSLDNVRNDTQILRDKIRLIHDENLKNLSGLRDNILGRIKILEGKAKVNWYKNWTLTEEDLLVLQGIFKAHVDWQHPCLELFPGTGQCAKHALGAEPLYIADWDKEVLEHVASQFNEYYATRRLIKYQIQGFDLSALPPESFGFVYCMNYLRFEDRQGLNNLAKEVYNLLLPGAHYLFNYAPTDRWNSMLSIEEGYAIGADTEDVSSDLVSIGFEIMEIHNRGRPCYILCRKPGDLEKIKASSILAKIIDRE